MKISEELKEIHEHEVVEGTVVLVNRDEAYVDIGYKQEIAIPKRELAVPEPDSAQDVVKQGDVIKVYIQSLGGENGGVLSKVKADAEVVWDELRAIKAHNDDTEATDLQTVDARISSVVKGGLLATVNGLRGFIPASQMELHFVKDLGVYVGQTVKTIPIEIEPRKRRIVLSRRQLLERESKAKQQEILLNKESRAKRVKLIIFDVDGVLTDGSIYHGANGELFKAFHCRDGFGITLAHSCGLKSAIITGRTSAMTTYRANELKISAVMQGQMNKRDAYKKIKAQFGLTDEEICYVADDVIDLPVFVQVGFRAAVGDASPEVIERAHYVANAFGGRGAVREIIEFILKAKGFWAGIIERYTAPEFDDKELTALNQ